ncbi:type VI secretion system-associated FHA domain protein [Massilia sp. S19_KUP03_FR1]|uniref:type VI secretion system-associated FHA domain protein n=1 Tax=Massilia sp. S19_KUP03_FR1 TaxID=3025503 RepID=UPI002FCD9728
MSSPELSAVPTPDESASPLLQLKLAFLRGAGLRSAAMASELTPETMELLGKLLASSLQGTIDLLALRSLVKQEVNADVTTVLVRNNNPLKFFTDSQTVLTQMMRKKMPGFMEPLEALEDAQSDLHAHQHGMTAGARACLVATLEPLAGEQVSAVLPPPGFADKLLPHRRGLVQWHEYLRRHRAAVIGIDAQLHGPAFLAAYDAAVVKSLAGSRKRAA